jgi:hypothetical protein
MITIDRAVKRAVRACLRYSVAMLVLMACGSDGNADPDMMGRGSGGSSGSGGSPSASDDSGGTGGAAIAATGGKGGGAGTSAAGSPATGGRSAMMDGSGGMMTAGSGGSSGGESCPTENEEKFSFFITSQKALVKDSGKPDGYGGNLGGITGADAICQRIAESVSACQKNKVWHAFLSTTKVNAIERIGSGPWYDRTGRLVGNDVQDLLGDRPAGDAFFENDVSTEDGSPSHNPNGTGNVDNHETLTGTGPDGKVYAQGASTGMRGGATSCGGETEWTAEKATCWDWTSDAPMGCPRVGHSWPARGSGVNWISVWNEGGCAPGGNLNAGGLDGSRKVGSAGGYGGFYCFAVTPHP